MSLLDPRVQHILANLRDSESYTSVQRMNIQRYVQAEGADAVIGGLRKGLTKACERGLRDPKLDLKKACREMQRAPVIITNVTDAFKSSTQKIRQLSQSNLRAMQQDMSSANRNLEIQARNARVKRVMSGDFMSGEAQDVLLEAAGKFLDSSIQTLTQNPAEAAVLLFRLFNILGGTALTIGVNYVLPVALIIGSYKLLRAQYPTLPDLDLTNLTSGALSSVTTFGRWLTTANRQIADVPSNDEPVETPQPEENETMQPDGESHTEDVAVPVPTPLPPPPPPQYPLPQRDGIEHFLGGV